MKNITLNGVKTEISDNTTIDDLIREGGFEGLPCVVEINGKIVYYDDYTTRPVSGAVVRIRNFSGGG